MPKGVVRFSKNFPFAWIMRDLDGAMVRIGKAVNLATLKNRQRVRFRQRRDRHGRMEAFKVGEDRK
jgi:hypothetical protein